MKVEIWAVLRSVGIIAGLMVIVACPWAVIPQEHGLELVDEWAVWECDAPHGRYWIQSEGGGNVIYYHQDSSLAESYTIKYLEGDILKTKIIDSTSPILEIHLTSNQTMTFEKWQTHYKTGLGKDSFGSPTLYRLYIPDPKVLGEEGP